MQHGSINQGLSTQHQVSCALETLRSKVVDRIKIGALVPLQDVVRQKSSAVVFASSSVRTWNGSKKSQMGFFSFLVQKSLRNSAILGPTVPQNLCRMVNVKTFEGNFLKKLSFPISRFLGNMIKSKQNEKLEFLLGLNH